SSAARGPVVSHPERSVSATAATSSSPIAGGWKPSGVLRRVRIDPEAYGVGRTAPPLERAVAVGPRDEHPLDALLGLRLCDAIDLEQPAGRRDEEDDRRLLSHRAASSHPARRRVV